ncbi:hypothetical protein LSTR_LSTR010816 [Laodelphax striatellus]|uniref:Uncharacterized protein n=1 Tax=Laodelphax striatellus TaxID=195883 RepID=A0A482XJZ2_LAOST|nr:hypothetical protein LSTR_LSTR010816 [Laodelphax striatellus]
MINSTSLWMSGKDMLCLSNFYVLLLTSTLLLQETAAVSYRVVGYQSPEKVSMVHNPEIDSVNSDIKADTTILQVPEQKIQNLDERLCRPGYKMDKFKRYRSAEFFTRRIHIQQAAEHCEISSADRTALFRAPDAPLVIADSSSPPPHCDPPLALTC